MIYWDKPCYKCLSHLCDLSCKEALAQPEKEPVACLECKRLENELERANIKATVWKSAYDVEVGYNEQDTTPPQHILMAEYWKNQYEELKAKQWVGLTPDERETVLHDIKVISFDEYAIAIEAKLKEKNT